MTETTDLPASASRSLIVLPPKRTGVDIPDWEIARNLIFPFLEPTSFCPGQDGDISARNAFDPLSGMLTSCIKMSLALFYRGAIIPLSESLIREWSVSMAAIRLAMDANIALVSRSSRFEPHTKGSLTYYSLHSDAAPFNSVLPFYGPFQETCAVMLGMPFYFAVPERRTVILFGREVLPHYLDEFRNDILLTRDSSTSALSPELLEVSESGLVTISR